MKNSWVYILTSLLVLASCARNQKLTVTPSVYDLEFPQLAATWDEGMPLGNAVVGALIWEKDSALRMSLDRVDLWDLRPMDSISGENNRFSWVYDQVMKNDYLPVQKKFDHPYDRLPAPSKIPGAGLEFSLNTLGKPSAIRLFLNNALCEVDWANGTKLQTFVHATEPIGWFKVENASDDFIPELVPPIYNQEGTTEDLGPVAGLDLRRLGYKQGTVTKEANRITYHQPGWGDSFYDVVVQWEKQGTTLIGSWSITSSMSNDPQKTAKNNVQKALERGINTDYIAHLAFWNTYWNQSSISIPDTILAKQYANEIYKFGSATREDSYPISLQAVWTADNGKLPPWKGDYHHDLNTQLSYWPCYTGNHLREGLGYLNTLWNQREVNKQYTKQYFEKEGLNVPGVCTLTGVPMGGWIQYSMSPTVSAWLSQHFYLHYKYSKDPVFLREKAYPYLKDVATFLENFTQVDAKGIRKLPLSSSPEIYNNSINAWFKDMTNYDLSLSLFAFHAAAELAADLQLTDESNHWKEVAAQLPPLEVDAQGALAFAKGFPYNESHRHLSNSMAIHPLGIVDWSNGEADQKTIKATLHAIDSVGPAAWCGYTYSWVGNMKARARDGEGAAKALRIFAECFCLKNTFHANGDQSNTGKSGFTYRPFTLEGNFAFAAGIQEMLLQSHTDIIRIFPAIPATWADVSFDKLRAYGAFLISAEQKAGEVERVEVVSEQGGTFCMENPFKDSNFKVSGTKQTPKTEANLVTIQMEAGEKITFTK